MTDVERRFGEAMFAIYREARDIGYTPSIFLRMLRRLKPASPTFDNSSQCLHSRH